MKTKITAYKNPKILRRLYWELGFSICKIAKKFGVSNHTILYWFRKHKIPCRPQQGVQTKEHKISKKLLINLYWKKKLSLPCIASKLNMAYSGLHFKFLKCGIPRRSHSETNRMMWKSIGERISRSKRRYPRLPFSKDPMEKAYMIGLRMGDVSAERESSYTIRVSTGSTHPAQIKMFKKVFGRYGYCRILKVKNKLVSKEWQIRCRLNNSFSFLVEKPSTIPEWILKKKRFFLAFLAGIVDSEGWWCIYKNNKNSIGLTFGIVNSNRIMLEQLKQKLKKLRFDTHIRLQSKSGQRSNSGIFHKNNVYILRTFRSSQIARLAKILLPLSHHDKKIWKMKLVIKAYDLKKWSEIKEEVFDLRHKIKKSRLSEKILEGMLNDL